MATLDTDKAATEAGLQRFFKFFCVARAGNKRLARNASPIRAILEENRIRSGRAISPTWTDHKDQVFEVSGIEFAELVPRQGHRPDGVQAGAVHCGRPPSYFSKKIPSLDLTNEAEAYPKAD